MLFGRSRGIGMILADLGRDYWKKRLKMGYLAKKNPVILI